MQKTWENHPTKGIPRPDTSERMKLKNPMRNKESVEKMKNTLRAIGHKPSVRGGNGCELTKPQQKLLSLLQNAEAEYAINTKDARHLFQKVPNAYKVDLAIVDQKLAIEVDGSSHGALIRREQDERKGEILKSLGWSVLRFTNKEVMEDTQAVMTTIQKSMT